MERYFDISLIWNRIRPKLKSEKKKKKKKKKMSEPEARCSERIRFPPRSFSRKECAELRNLTAWRWLASKLVVSWLIR